MMFQNNLLTFLESKFEKADEKRERDNSFLKSQIKSMKNKQSSYEFKTLENRLQHNFIQEIYELNNEAKMLCEAGSKRRLPAVLDKIEEQLVKRQKIVKYADRSVAGWDAINEYFPNDLADDSDDDSRLRRAESRAMSKRKQRSGQFNQVPAKRFGAAQPSQNHILPLIQHQSPVQTVPLVPQVVQPQFPQHHVATSVQRPFLYQGAAGVGQQNFQLHNISQSQPIRYPVPLNTCFLCCETGHWKHQCPRRTSSG